MYLKLVLLVSVLCVSVPLLHGGESGKVVGRIYGGTNATHVDFPWLVAILRFGYQWCGGSILNKRMVLTAAHCLYETDAIQLMVRVGSKHKNSGGQVILVQDGAYHSDYNNISQDYDIGLLRLSWDIQFLKHVYPIRLPEQGALLAPYTDATVAGWGETEEGGAEFLRYLDVKIMRPDVCKIVYAHYVYTPRMLCAGLVDSQMDICRGDSGGPLVVNRTVVVGLVSFQATPSCGFPNQLGTYTRVSEMVDWVKSYLEHHGERL